MSERIATFADFWPYYLREHSRPVCRYLHYLGTVAAWGMLALGITASPWFYLGIPFAGYGPAWVGHFFIEHNKPATFKYPIWSLLADYRMFFSAMTGNLRQELQRALDES